MKVLLASSSSGSKGGGEMYLVYLGRALASRGHDVQLWVSDHERMDLVATAFAAIGTVHRRPYTNTYDRKSRCIGAFLDGATARRAAAEWDALQPDIVHINKQNLEDGLDLIEATRFARTRSVCTIHLTQKAGFLGAQFAGMRDLVAWYALQRYRGVFITVQQERRRNLESFLGSGERIRTVENGVPLADLEAQKALRVEKRRELGLEPGERLVIGMGRMAPQKRPLLFLQIALDVRQRYGASRFLWVGDGPLVAEWDAAVTSAGVTRQVSRVGWQSDVQPFLAAADAFLHVAEFEGLPLALLEAMSAGLPCAVTPNLLGDMPFLHAAHPIAAQPAEELTRALESPSLLARSGAAARRLVEERFSFDRMARECEALYHEAASQPARP